MIDADSKVANPLSIHLFCLTVTQFQRCSASELKVLNTIQE